MLAGIIDHLWQSLAFAAIVLGVTYLTRRNSAALQLWLWRIAALKFLLPLGLLFAWGAWLGTLPFAVPFAMPFAIGAPFACPLATT